MWSNNLLSALRVACALVAALQSSGSSMAQPSQAHPSASTQPSPACQVREPVKSLPAALAEASGAAASEQHPGIVWTHNDSSEPVLFAVDSSGKQVSRVRLTGAEVVDWESVTAASCEGERGQAPAMREGASPRREGASPRPEGASPRREGASPHREGASPREARSPMPEAGSPRASCLFVGDIGDNDAERESVTVYRVREPALDAQSSEPVTKLVARYPDGPRNAEALFVLPPGQIFIVTKGDTSPVEVYRFPRKTQSAGPAVLERVRTLRDEKVKARERVTGADADPDGRWVVLRTGASLSAYDANEFIAGGHAIWQMDLSALGESQGEGVALGRNGLVTLIGERGDGELGTFARLQCAFAGGPLGTSGE